jgi:8-oxo-dGTP diphosphatase
VIRNGVSCPKCGARVTVYRNPLLTVDIIIEVPESGIVLIERKNPPLGWALPGGFVDYGESLEDAARREAKEETGLDLDLLRQFRAYSDPDRDPRHHTVSMVFTARARGRARAADDAKNLEIFPPDSLPDSMAFDHTKILNDYLEARSAKAKTWIGTE